MVKKNDEDDQYHLNPSRIQTAKLEHSSQWLTVQYNIHSVWYHTSYIQIVLFLAFKIEAVTLVFTILLNLTGKKQ